MTTHDHHHDHDAPLPDDLRRGLQALRQDHPPGRDLWPGIAARIAAAPTTASPPRPTQAHHGRRRRRLAALATAASLAAVVAVAWTLLPVRTHDTTGSDAVAGLMLREARSMTREYETAWRELDARRRPDADASGLRELDRGAAQVRAALRKDPDARYLLQRLQSLYSRRLDLAQRLAVPT